MNAPIPPLGLHPIPDTPGQVRTKPIPTDPTAIAKRNFKQSAPRFLLLTSIVAVICALDVLLATAGGRGIDSTLAMLLGFSGFAIFFVFFVVGLSYFMTKWTLQKQAGHLYQYAFDPGFIYSYSTFGVSSQLAYASFSYAKNTNDCLILFFYNYYRAYIPYSSFESPADLQTALSYLRQAGKLK